MSEEWPRERLAWLVREVTCRLPRVRGAGRVTANVVDWFPSSSPTVRNIDLGDGLRFTVDVSQKYERSMFFSPQLYEFRSIALLRRHLRPGGIFVDIGANIGLFSVFAAQMMGPEGLVVAIEPAPDTFSRLLSNLTINSLTNVRAIQNAVSDAEGLMPLYRNTEGNTGANSLSASVTTTASPIDVEVRTLDHILDDVGIDHVDLVKIDIEGWEVKALQQSRLLRQKPRPIVITEAKDKLLRAAGSSLEEMDEMFRQADFVGRNIDRRDRIYA